MGRWFQPSAHFYFVWYGLFCCCRFQPTGYIYPSYRRRSRRRPRGLQGGRAAADQGRSPQGRAALRARKGPGRRRRQAPETSSENYEYDKIGNLVRDSSEQIEEIVWNVQGKVQEVHFEAGKAGPSVLQYEYDPMGNRLAKKKLYVDGPVDIRSEGQYYVRDPQGNVLAVYQYNEENIALVDDKDSLYLEELHLYGSARLGILKKALALRYRDESGTANWSIRTLAKTALAQSSYQQLELGRRRYELSNHLGNVLATVSDKSLGQDSSQTGQADYYLAQVSSASLYYPFGWEMPGRKFVSGEDYRFGFNGKEDDRDWGTQNIQDYGFRLYNPSIGKFLSVDPLSPDYPELTCYQFASNTPIYAIDRDGLEMWSALKYLEPMLFGTTHIKKTEEAVVDAATMPLRAGATGVHVVVAGAAKIPQYAQGDFSGGAPVYYDYMNYRWVQGGSNESEETMHQMSWVAIEEGASAAIGGAGGILVKGVGKAAFKIWRKSPCSCFEEGTLVNVRDGYKEIEAIKEGDFVWAYDEKTGDFALKKVSALFQDTRDTLLHIYVGNTVIFSTPNHSIFANNRFVRAEDLSVNDTLLLLSGEKQKIDSINIETGTYKVYNFTVEDYHTYFIGKSGLLVHNNNPCLVDVWIPDGATKVLDKKIGTTTVHRSKLFQDLDVSSWDEFYKKTAKKGTGEQKALYRRAWDDLVEANTGKKGTWEQDKLRTKLNKRPVYYDTKNKKYYAYDSQHGTIEMHDNEGNGLYEFKFDGTYNKENKHKLKGL